MAERDGIEIPIYSEGASEFEEQMHRIGLAVKKLKAPFEDLAGGAKGDFDRIKKAAAGVNTTINTLSNVGSFGLLGISTAAGAVTGAFSMTKGAIDGVRGAIDTLRSAATEAAAEVRLLSVMSTSLNIDDRGGVSAEARTEALIQAIQGVTYDTSTEDISAMILDLTTLFNEARDGDEEAIKQLRNMKLSKSVAFDGKGQIKETTDLLFGAIDAISKLDKTTRRTELIKLLGSDGFAQFGPLFEKSTDGIKKSMDEFLKLNSLTDDVIAQSAKVAASQSRVAAAAKGLQRQLMSGLAPAISETDAAWGSFLAGQQDEAKALGDLAGDFMSSAYTDIIQFAEQASRDLGGVGGDLRSGPIATGLDYLSQAIDYVLERLSEVVKYLGTGQSTDWIDTVVSALTIAKEGLIAFKDEAISAWGVLSDEVFPAVSDLAVQTYTLLKEDLIPAIKSVIEAVQEVYSWFGVDSPGMQLGLTIALVAFSGTITAAIGGMMTLAAWALKASGAIGGAAAATGAAASTLAPLAAAAVPVAAVAAGAGIGYLGLREDKILDSQVDLYTRMEALAKQSGGEVAAAFGVAMEAELAAQAGESWIDWYKGFMSKDFDNKGERVARMSVELEGMSRDEIIAKVAQGVQQAQTAISDDTVIELPGDIQITGLEINEAIKTRLAAIPATLDIAAVTGLDRAIAEASRGISVPTGAVANVTTSSGPTSTVNVTLPGGNTYVLTAPTGQANDLAREINRMSRTR